MRYLLLFCSIILFASCDKEVIHETVVIGGGLMGSSAAWHLSKRGEPVLLLEQQKEFYKYGSSLGETRIARSLGPEGDIWGALHDETVSQARQLVNYLNGKDDKHKIDMDDIYTTSPVTYVRHLKQLERIEALMYDGQPDEFKYAGNPTTAKSLFGMRIPDTTIVIREFKQYSGTINPKALIAHTHHAIEHSGNKIKYHAQVKSITREEGLYRIVYSDMKNKEEVVIYSKKVICAAGPWTGALLKNIAPQVDGLLNPQRVFLAYLKIKAEVYNKLSANQQTRLNDGYPLINSSLGTRMGSNFSMIEGLQDRVPIVKIGGHFQRSAITDLSNIWEQELSAEELAWAVDRFHQYLQYLDLPIGRGDILVHDTYSCVYTLTKNEVPYISYGLDAQDNKDKNLIIMAGLSGVGGKGSLAYGRMAADLIMNIEPHSEMDKNIRERMSLNRDK